jgi:phage-related protein
MPKSNKKYPIDYIAFRLYIENVVVEFYKTARGNSPVEEFILSLISEDRARFADVFEGIKKYGLQCPRVVFKPIEGKLWEIKFSSESGGYRVLYVLLQNSRMIWLHAFRKSSQKTLKKDLVLAKKRLKEVLDHEK